MKNIILVGMPGCGKSTVGVVLAKTLGMQFVDTDLIIQHQNHDVLHKLIERYGLKRFEEMEEEALLSVTETKGMVIATGGGAVFIGYDSYKSGRNVSNANCAFGFIYVLTSCPGCAHDLNFQICVVNF